MQTISTETRIGFLIRKAKTWIRQHACPHKEFNCDKQIRVIECTKCGKRSRIGDYVDLFPPRKYW